MGIKESTRIAQQLLELTQKGVQFVDEGITDLINDHGEAAARARYAAQQAQLEAEQTAQLASQQTALESVTAYLSKTRRPVTEITAEIEAKRTEQAQLMSEHANLKAESSAGAPSAKAAVRWGQVVFALEGFPSRLKDLETELHEAEQADIVSDHAARVRATVAMTNDLLAFEASAEWQEIKKRFEDGIQRINHTRAILRVKQVTGRNELENKYGGAAVQAVGDKLTVIDQQIPPIIWK